MGVLRIIENQQAHHHWIGRLEKGRCGACEKQIKGKDKEALYCSWCHTLVHENCVNQLPETCSMGKFGHSILPPTCVSICILNSEEDVERAKKNVQSVVNVFSEGFSFSVQLLEAKLFKDLCPVIVLVNSKSGGGQGERVSRKFMEVSVNFMGETGWEVKVSV